MVKDKSILKTIFTMLTVLLAYSFVYIPIFVLVLFSFCNTQLPHLMDGFSLCWYKKMFLSKDMLGAITNSCFIALASSFFSVLLSTLFTVASIWWSIENLFVVFWVNLIIPEIVLAVGLLMFFCAFKIPLGFTALIAGHSIIGMGFAIPIIRDSLNGMDLILVEAAMDLGASYWRVFIDILLPQLKNAIFLAAFLVFTISLDDFFIAFFCSGSGLVTISTYVYSQTRTIPDPSLNALSTMLLVISLLIIYFILKIRANEREERQ